jgi:hypothetical protein
MYHTKAVPLRRNFKTYIIMKKIIYFTMIVALALVSCQKPVNPPQSQVQREQIVEICYKSIGQSADFFLEEMEKMNIELTQTWREEVEDYTIITDKYKIGFSLKDGITIFSKYEFSFVDTYVNGGKIYFDVSDKIASYGWDKYRADKYKTIEERAAFVKEKTQELDECMSSIYGIFEQYEKVYEDKYLKCNPFYWGESVGGLNPNTGQGESKMIASSISVEFELLAESRL